MSQNLEMPDSVFRALNQVAEANGMTPVGWIAAHLPSTALNQPPATEQVMPATLKERMAGRIGRIRSGESQKPFDRSGDKFTEYLLAKKRAGHL